MPVSDEPTLAPADYRTQPMVKQENMPWSEVVTGPGWATDLACDACNNRDGNLCIYDSYNCSRNGDVLMCKEVWCAACNKYSTFTESR